MNRLRPLLNDLLHPAEAGFIPGRKAKDNILLLNEVLHGFIKNLAKRPWMMIKIDLDKACDGMEWNIFTGS